MPRQITVHDLAQMRAAKAPLYMLDVRSLGEHQLVALPESVLIPLHELPARVAEIQPPPGATVVAYCHHGIRSLHAAAFLEQAGHANVVSLAGGIDAWSREIDPSVRRYQ
jgi:adenylyltransferase/sulfurtransferase